MGQAVVYLRNVQRTPDSTTWQRPLCCTRADSEGMVNTSLEVAAFLDQIREREREMGHPPPPRRCTPIATAAEAQTSRRIFRENAEDPNSF